jgi:hypothetical protein
MSACNVHAAILVKAPDRAQRGNGIMAMVKANRCGVAVHRDGRDGCAIVVSPAHPSKRAKASIVKLYLASGRIGRNETVLVGSIRADANGDWPHFEAI